MLSTETSDIPQGVLRAAANRVFEFETAIQSGQFNDDPEGVGAHDMLTLLFAHAILAERERSAAAAEKRGFELSEAAVGSDIANTIRMGGEA